MESICNFTKYREESKAETFFQVGESDHIFVSQRAFSVASLNIYSCTTALATSASNQMALPFEYLDIWIYEYLNGSVVVHKIEVPNQYRPDGYHVDQPAPLMNIWILIHDIIFRWFK